MKAGKTKEILTSNQMLIVYIIVVLSLAIGLKNSAFFSFTTVVSISRAILVTLIFALGEMVVIISGGIDVSFPAVACAALYIPMKYFVDFGIDNMFLAFIIAACIGLIVGALNAVLISIIKIPPLIATLGMSSVVSGALLTFVGTKEIGTLPPSAVQLSKTYLFTVKNAVGNTYAMPIFILIPVILAIVVHFVLKYTMLGRGIYAIGGDQNAARIAGFNVKKLQFIVYMYCGCFCGIAGLIYAILSCQAHPMNLMGSEMMVIAAIVVGGTRITGGHGTVIGTVLGVILIGLIQNNLIMLGVPSYWQTFVVGAVIIIGTAITSLKALAIEKSSKV